MNKNRSKYKSLLVRLVFVVFLLIFIFLFSRILSHFMTGASFSDKIETYDTILNHIPEIEWHLDHAAGIKKINKNSLNDIEIAYKSAWYGMFSHADNEKKTKIDFWTDDWIDSVTYINHKVDKIDLAHNLHVDLYSLDKQLISFTDSFVWIVKDIQMGTKKIRVNECKNFHVIMKLKDGKWKIAYVNELSDCDYSFENIANKKELPDSIRGINYYPKNTPWNLMWQDYRFHEIRKDLSLIKKLNYNSVRIFLPDHFAYSQDYLSKLDAFLLSCEKENLKVIATLFDFPKSFSLKNYSAYQKQLRILTNRYRTDTTLIAWDLKNEPDLDFSRYNKQQVLSWLNFLVDVCYKYDTQQQITIGWSTIEFADLLADRLDFVSFHQYGNIDKLNDQLVTFKANYPEKRLVLGEFGYSEIWNSYFNKNKLEKNKGEYISNLSNIMKANNYHDFIVWTLHDFDQIPPGIFGSKFWIKKMQSNFGIVDDKMRPREAHNILGQKYNF